MPSILLKGAAIATWLYEDGSARPYCDIDILISPASMDNALHALRSIGYTERVRGAHPAELGPKEVELIGPTNMIVDLHHGLLGATAASEHCWDVLATQTVMMNVGGIADLPVLNVPARAMHLALHAAQNGPIDVKPIRDLERGVSALGIQVWEEASRIAKRIGAEQAFAAGLRLVPAGRELADKLSLTHAITVELALRTASVTQDALFFERFARTHGPWEKAALLLRKLFPTAATMRANYELARRGSLGLLCAWIQHPLSLARRFRPAITAWYRARQSTYRSG